MMTTDTTFRVVGKTHRDGELTITEGFNSQRMIPLRRLHVTMPRWERRRMRVAERNHAGLVLYRLQQAKWDAERDRHRPARLTADSNAAMVNADQMEAE